MKQNDLELRKKAAYDYLSTLRNHSNQEMIFQDIPSNDQELESILEKVLVDNMGTARNIDKKKMLNSIKHKFAFDQDGNFNFDEEISNEGYILPTRV